MVTKPTPSNKLLIYSDGNFSYETTLPEYFPTDAMDYGKLIKIKENGILVDKKKIIVFGDPQADDIETTTVECFNTILRNRLSRLVRKTQCHSKNKYRLKDAVNLFQFYWNFMKPLHKRMSPAIMEGLETKLWTWGRFLHIKLTFVN